jgi:hypothetical protein
MSTSKSYTIVLTTCSFVGRLTFVVGWATYADGRGGEVNEQNRQQALRQGIRMIKAGRKREDENRAGGRETVTFLPKWGLGDRDRANLPKAEEGVKEEGCEGETGGGRYRTRGIGRVVERGGRVRGKLALRGEEMGD